MRKARKTKAKRAWRFTLPTPRFIVGQKVSSEVLGVQRVSLGKDDRLGGAPGGIEEPPWVVLARSKQPFCLPHSAIDLTLYSFNSSGTDLIYHSYHIALLLGEFYSSLEKKAWLTTQLTYSKYKISSIGACYPWTSVIPHPDTIYIGFKYTLICLALPSVTPIPRR